MIDATKLKEVNGWKDLWEENVFPWHKSDIHPKLEQNLDVLIQASGKSSAKDCKFFVPLCGKSIDMVFLQTKGFQVIGCEGVEKPCIDFFKENAIDYDKKIFNEDFAIFEAKSVPIKIVCGDYFKLTPEILGGKMDCIFDRGSLVAIDKSKRIEYAEVMMKLVNDHFGYLIACIERPEDPPGAMPNSLSFPDVKDLFGKHFGVHLMESTVNEKGIKDHTFLLSSDKAKTGSPEDRLDMWKGRWADSKCGWHKLNVNEHLLKYFDLLKNGKDKLKILFPLCGKSLDLVHCYNEGHTVVGIEGVPMPVEELFKNGNLKFERNFCEAIDGFIYKTADSRLTVFVCDFFKMKPELLAEKCDAVYDRGAFEAVYESDREAYVKTVLPLLTPDFRYLLNVYEYEDEVFKGPPRSCKRDEVNRLFSGHSIEGVPQVETEVLTDDRDLEAEEKFNGIANSKFTMLKLVHLIKPKQ